MLDAPQTLEQRLAAGPVPVDEAVRIVWALCDRFEKQGKAETMGDVSPARVTLHGRVVEAKVPDAAPVAGYSAPERASAGPTPRSDVYAMGRLLVHLLFGRPDSDGPFPPEASHLQVVAQRCLQPNPADRYANLTELKRALVRMDKTLVSGPRLVATQELLVRDMLGPWKLEGLLGQGSMGTVYRGRHQALGRLAAIKVLRPEQYQSPELVQRFFQEARTVNQINHEHIVEISDFVQEPGPSGPSIVYCVMEFLQGRTLGDELDSGAVPIERGVRIVEQLADALAAAHRVGVVHRDVKPDNIMLIERGGSRDYVKVLDFGVAKLTHTDGKAMVSTTEGAIIGTPICMSPEQTQGEDIDARSDVWAVGVILYRMLTGQFPFDAPTFVNIAVQIVTKPFAPLPTKNALGERIPERLARLVERCLQKRRDLRPASMTEVRDELRAIFAEPEPRGSRGGLGKLLAGVAVVALLGGGGFLATRERVVVPPPVEPLPVALVVDAGTAPVEDAGVVEVVVDAGAPEPLDAGVDDEVEDAGVVTKVQRPVKPIALTAEVVGGLVQKVRVKVDKCLHDNAALTAKLGGREATLRFTIERSGALTGVAFDEPVKGTALEQCVVRGLKNTKLPPNDGNANFTKPRLRVSIVAK